MRVSTCQIVARRWSPPGPFTLATSSSVQRHARHNAAQLCCPPHSQSWRSFAEQARGDGPERLDFSDARSSFESKSNFELLRTWAVFQTCNIGWVVRHCDSLYNFSLKVLGKTLTHGLLRHSMFNHFCAGESAAGITPRMEHLRKYGIGGILDYAAEAKDEEPIKAEQPACEASTIGAPKSARNYTYSGEAICDANTEIFLDAIRAVRDSTPDGFAAIKLSGLGDPKLLERMSTCLTEITHLFLRLSDPNMDMETVRKTPYYSIDRSFQLDFQAFSEGWKKLFQVSNDEDLLETFNRIDSDNDGKIGFFEWSDNMRLSHINDLVRSCTSQGPLTRAALDDQEVQLYHNLIQRMQRILDLAKELGVRVMVDAEWVDIQPAIDHVVLFHQREYNVGDRPIVFQTYQTYLKGMHGSALRDLDRAKRENWRFGAKLVRGAYMVSEREKARARGVESPICETYEETQENYHKVIDSVMHHNVDVTTPTKCGDAQAELLIASHNKDSIDLATSLMHTLNKDRGTVYFGQLLGMADHLTFTLARHGYKAYKYVPYGPIEEVVPYLIRRTQENSAILGSEGVQEERGMVGQELRRRMLPM